MAADLAGRILERAHRFGPLPFDEFLQFALYDEEGGFFERRGGAGRTGGDFLTSPEVGPLYGAVLARALDAWWDELGRPDPFVVAEVGAGSGTLARDVLAARPACGAALRYLLVETSASLRERQSSLLPLEPASMLLGPIAEGEDDDADARPAAGSGPLVASLAELPAERFTGVVFANELLDNLPFLLLERGPDAWREVRVGDVGDGRLGEVLVGASPAVEEAAERLAPDAPVGGRIALQRAARAWVADTRALLRRGRVVAVDYTTSTPEMARRPWREWLRTYRGHAPGGSPLEAVGDQDVTCEVAVDQLPAPTVRRTQAQFLRAYGVDDLAGEARARWQAGAAAPDLRALQARSRVGEAAALTDESGLGGFEVLEWVVEPGR